MTGLQILKGYALSALFQIENHLGVQPDRKPANVRFLIKACEVARLIEKSEVQAWALGKLGVALAEAQQWERAKQLIYLIGDSDEMTEALRALVEMLTSSSELSKQLHLIQRSWLQVNRRNYVNKLLCLVHGLISFKPEIGVAFYEAFSWVDAFSKG